MKETLINIVNSISSYEIEAKKARIGAIARVHCINNGKKETFWFTNVNYNPRQIGELSKFGRFVYKKSDVATKMQKSEIGTSFEYEQMSNIKRMQKYCIQLENRSDFQNKTIVISGDETKYQYRNIREFLKALQDNREDIKDVESKIADLKSLVEELKKQKNTSIQRGKITKSINELKKEYRILTQQQEDLKNITIYIRKQGEMRYSLLVDTIQTKIKSENLFDGTTVIIDGGPGTGKSTTMIHRLSYLTDLFAIDEDEKNHTSVFQLKAFQRKKLREAINTNRDWMFFSPSHLLKEYLAEAMKKENMTNTSSKVWNWTDYCRMILQDYYHLLEIPSSKAPFRLCFLQGTLFYQKSNIINDFTEYYLNELRELKEQFPKIKEDVTVYRWASIAKSIEKMFEGYETFSIARFITLFNNIESTYKEDCDFQLDGNNDDIKNLTNDICDLLDQHKDVKADVKDILDLSLEESDIIDEDNDDEQDELYDELYDEIKKWLKAYCGSKARGGKLSDEQQLISDIIEPLLGNDYDNRIQRIGGFLLFEQFAKCTKGVKVLMLNIIPKVYKNFRKHLIRTKYEGCNLGLLRDISQRNQGKELHFQEQSLLLGFINNLVKHVKASGNERITHAYIDAYDELSRPIIGVDEATDFSACDIYAIESLLTRGFNSLTLCGDMMQRMTSHGIKSWEELNGIVQNPKVVKMKTSYRQSQELLEVARQLHKDALGEVPNYKAFMKSKKVPAPLACINESEHVKIEWISKRVSEVHRAYGGQLPSIAIFVNDKGYVPKFIENLQQSEFFKKNNIKVKDGTEAHNSAGNHICVYPIDVVKGMEFDVVFFHNIDNSSEDMEMLKRYIYVGVSRAAFFLGITMTEDNQEISKYFDKKKDWFKI